MTFESKFIASSQGDLHILEQAGNEETPFFFLHGNSLCASAYLPFLEILGEKSGRQIVAADIRGHGLSTNQGVLPLKNWDVFVEDLAFIIKKSLKTPVTGLGHSMGGAFLYMAAARFPGLFSHLVLLDPVIFLPYQVRIFRCIQATGLKNWFSLPQKARKKRSHFPNRQSAADHYRGKGMFRNWQEKCLQGFVRDGLRPSPGGGFDLSCSPELEARFYESVPPEARSYAKKILCPVHAVRAEFSRFFPQKASRLLQKSLPDGHLALFQKAGHFFPLDLPEKSAELVAGYCGFS